MATAALQRGLCFRSDPGMAGGMETRSRKRQVVSFFLCLCVSLVACETIRYSVREEKKSGSLVANIVQDLKLDVGKLLARRARLVSKSTKQYFELNTGSGDVIIKEKIDREDLCGQNDPCLLQFEIVLENPLQLYPMEVQIDDMNDNNPKFSKNEFVLKMPEQIPINTRFPLERAQDSDIGTNGIQSYAISANEHFRLDVHSREDGHKYAELVLEKQLDREEQAQLMLILTAADGGLPQRTGTAQIRINVLDTNDNFPRFSQSVYKVQLMENSPRDTLVTKVQASDLDEGSNAEITYSFRQVPDRVLKLFQLDQFTGEITVLGIIDFEDAAMYEIEVQATDGGGLSAHCKVLVQIEDMNDNAPEVTLTSLTSTIPEDSSPETVVALFSVRDPDSGDNGRTLCSIQDNVPFALKSTLKNYYELVTQKPLDREKVPEYNISITATDRGTPRLTSVRIIRVQLSDINDNPPVFNESSYVMYLKENNHPGLLIGTVHAADLDTEQNAKVTYSALPGNIGHLPFSINSENGNVYALQSVDYEQTRDFQVTVRAADGGFPPLSSEVIVRVVIIDENDNAPFILYPLQNNSAPANDLVPRSAEAGYLVTKVVAVDGDSGQNSWLSYHLLKATDPGLFAVGLQTGEVKTSRPIRSPDSVKQKLIVLVRDNGEPPRSTTSTLNVLLVDGFSDAYMQLLDVPQEEEQQDTLTLYLVISLSFVSFLFLVSVVTIIAIRVYKTRQCRERYVPSSRNFYCEPNFPTNPADRSGTGTLPQSYEVCLTTGSGTSKFKFLRPLVPSLPADPSAAGGSVLDSQINSHLKEEREPLREDESQYWRTNRLLSSTTYEWLQQLCKRGLCFRSDPGMAGGMETLSRKRQVVSFFLCLCVSLVACETIRYSSREEKKSGSLVANIAKDLNLDVGKLFARRARLISKSTKQYFELNTGSGDVIIKEKIDREDLCGQSDPCLLQFEILLENPLQLYSMEVQIDDVNDNNPKFSKNEFVLKIPEQMPINTRFPLERAQDSDIGTNGIQSYAVSSNEHFSLDVQTRGDRNKYAELVLEKQLDREEQAQLMLILTAADGGLPQRTGTAQIRIIVLDTNDNFPRFSQSVYKVQLMENSPQDTLVTKVQASDLDEGSNAEITYSFGQVPDLVLKLFQLDQFTGEITVLGIIDFEDAAMYEIEVQATDGGGFSSRCKVLVQIEDMNDNAPEVTLTSLTSTIPEDSSPETVVALFSVRDPDSGDNGRTVCSIQDNVPFALKSTLKNYHELVTQKPLDREKVPEYNISITATDRGTPRLTSVRIIRVQLSDINDNPPVFNESSYVMYLKENNHPGLLIGTVHAADLDTEQNAKVTYSALPGNIGHLPFSINSENGNVYALQSVDYEQTRDFQVSVKAADGGSPPLSSEVIVRVVIIDENDNAPFILYPLQNSSSPANDLVPRSAEAGYLVTKVVAVDGDSGQNSWLSYQLLKATDPGLFAVSLQTGEVKTSRPIRSPDSVKQKLIVLVRDNGEPPRSTTSTLNVLLVDGFSDAYMQLLDVPQEEEQQDTLTLYLVISLSFVSFLFLVSVVTIIAIRVYKTRQCRERYVPSSRNFYCEPNFPTNPADRSGTGTLPQSYCYEVCLTTGSGTSEFKFLRPLVPSLPADPSVEEGSVLDSQINSHLKEEKEFLREGRASVSEDSISRSSGTGCIVNKVIGINENSSQNGWLSYQ
ncbi:LOW QUALITY PROTEIN: uncharacterized protein LOC119859958 [Dermochelys coriacea]|uniref:LOW QUALITY PROTEIN: uncharacterized protein LOC119859958 n=1 Tax=Dermochelys coriacea TaxID=27794 RepID=UPI0018E7D88B|nr:LOW QUALITY PROTEIN: uncharacterized protein LOC119859958 [Dermochelys coriacea]